MLVQIRGDWEFYANYLFLPHWASKHFCCWCLAGVDSFAKGYAEPLSSVECFSLQRDRARTQAALFAAPGVSTAS
eukprot:5322542-Amphidinium_carterae.2